MVKRVFFLSLFICMARVVYAQDTTTTCAPEPVIDAQEMHYEHSPINKLGRGLINTATCWAEVPAEMFKVSKERDPFLGITLGVGEGVFTALLRGLSGIFDTLTFAVGPYDRPLMEPEYAVKSLEQNYNDYLLFKNY